MNWPPVQFLYHYTPLVAVYGLGDSAESSVDPLTNDGEPLSVGSLGPVSSEFGADLKRRLEANSHAPTIWEPSASKASRTKFRHLLHIKFVTSVSYPRYLNITKLSNRQAFRLPGIKASGERGGAYPDGDNHSSMSPLNPHSAVYPNGLLTVDWVNKYLSRLPGSMILVQEIGKTNENDAHLVNGIISLKDQLGKRNLRLVVLLVSNDGDSSLYNERVTQIRRATGLPQRTGLFFAPKSSDLEKETLVETICQLVYTNALDFYGSIQKTIRAKRSRSPNEEVGSLKVITSLMWESRYAFKLASLTEFSQDFETALKHYWSAYDCIMDFVREVDITDTKLWTQGRALLDVVAHKIVKICMYQLEPNTAFRKFELHENTVRRIVQEKELSLGHHEFKSWLARQYYSLAELVKCSQDLFLIKGHALAPGVADAAPNSRLPRSGFLWLQSYKYLTSVNAAQKDGDSYGSLPAETVEQMKFSSLNNASEDFASTVEPSMSRSLAYCWYLLGETHEMSGDAKLAVDAYKEAAALYRRDGWGTLLEACIGKLASFEKQIDPVTRVTAQLELLKIGSSASRKANKTINRNLGEKTVIDDTHMLFFNAQFAFGVSKSHSGVEIQSQLRLEPLMRTEVVITQVELHFSGVIFRPYITIKHNESVEKSPFTDIGRLHVMGSDDSNPLIVDANLSFDSSDGFRVFQFEYVPKNIGNAELENIVLHVEGSSFTRNQTIPGYRARHTEPIVRWQGIDDKNCRALRLENPHSVQIDPRPSRVLLKHNASSTVAPGESVKLELAIANKEDDDIVLDIEGSGSLGDIERFAIDWVGNHVERRITAGKESTFEALFRIPIAVGPTAILEFSFSYHLALDPSTPIKDALSLSLPVAQPFRVSFDVLPRLQPDDWPSLFIIDENPDAQRPVFNRPLIAKRWDLSASLLVLDESPIEIHKAELQVDAPPDVKVSIVDGPLGLSEEPKQLKHNDGLRIDYLFDCALDSNPRDARRNNVSAEAHLKVFWSRSSSSHPEVSEFVVPVVRMTLPLYEPRVIADISDKGDSRYIHLRYCLENATNHVLTFNATVGTSPSFAFSGPRRLSLRILPFSRRFIEFQLLPLSSGALKLPAVKIVDTYYKRQLPIIPACGAIRVDRSSLIIVV